MEQPKPLCEQCFPRHPDSADPQQGLTDVTLLARKLPEEEGTGIQMKVHMGSCEMIPSAPSHVQVIKHVKARMPSERSKLCALSPLFPSLQTHWPGGSPFEALIVTCMLLASLQIEHLDRFPDLQRHYWKLSCVLCHENHSQVSMEASLLDKCGESGVHRVI